MLELPIPQLGGGDGSLHKRIDAAIKCLPKMEAARNNAEWSEVIDKSRKIWELINDQKSIAMLFKKADMDTEAITTFKNLIDQLYTLKNRNGKPIFFIELKDPNAKDGKSVFDNNVLMREVERAQCIDIKYLGNCNFLACAFFDKDKLYVEQGYPPTCNNRTYSRAEANQKHAGFIY